MKLKKYVLDYNNNNNNKVYRFLNKQKIYRVNINRGKNKVNHGYNNIKKRAITINFKVMEFNIE